MSNIKIIPCNQLSLTPWKNGLGETRQIAIYPPNADLINLNFIYRLSMASIKSENSFSLFPSFMRYLTILDGGSLLLNDDELVEGEIIHFNGEAEIHSRPICKKSEFNHITDLGIIYHPEKCHVQFEKKTANQTRIFKTDQQTDLYLVIQSGSAKCDNIIVSKMDTIFITNNEQVTVEFQNCCYYEVSCVVF